MRKVIGGEGELDRLFGILKRARILFNRESLEKEVSE